MTLNLRRSLWALALAFAVSTFALPRLAVAYQSEQGVEHGRGHHKDKDKDIANNPNYKLGMGHGQDDRANNRARQYRVHPDNDADRRAYESGYDRGYQGNRTYTGQYGSRQYGNRPYAQNSPERIAYDNGFKEGLGYGQSDRNSGHSNRPTYSSTYQHGTNGYNSSYGSETAYKNAFREGFKAGYAQGYNQGYRR